VTRDERRELLVKILEETYILLSYNFSAAYYHYARHDLNKLQIWVVEDLDTLRNRHRERK